MVKTTNVTLFRPDGGKAITYGDVHFVICHDKRITFQQTTTLSGGREVETRVESTLPYHVEKIIEHDGTVTV